MVPVKVGEKFDYEAVNIDSDWNDSNDSELIMHTIHSYPAKFPAFIAWKAFEYAQNEGVKIKNVSDIFCGCGTVALEAKIHGYDFWGCDINPVATLIARTKSNTYNVDEILYYYERIKIKIENLDFPDDLYLRANARLQYWYYEKSYCVLYKLHYAIVCEIPEGKYREAFECIFSSILKACSKWLTKSIKPQVDPNKKEIDVLGQFDMHLHKFIKAVEEIKVANANTIIKCTNFLNEENLPKVDLIITSPPYVTSYEYADLHQLSSLWLGYADDYRTLRRGSIGSVYNSDAFFMDMKNLNNTGKNICEQLINIGMPMSKVKSVARYYVDMQNAVEKCYGMLRDGGMVFFVVGDTEYKNVRIQNSRHLVEVLEKNKFHDIKIGKRTISKRICIPYRDETGKFSKDKSKRKVYHEEFIISGRL